MAHSRRNRREHGCLEQGRHLHAIVKDRRFTKNVIGQIDGAA